MARGLRGQWRPTDPTACALHVARIRTDELEGTFKPSKAKRPVPSAPVVRGPARAAKMSAENQSVSAKRASSARWAAAMLVMLSPALASAQNDDLARWQQKRDRATAVETGPQVRALVPPGRSTSTRDYLGFELHQGGVYEPSAFPTEAWLEIACIHDDLETPYSRAKHGSALIRVHAIVYNADLDEIHNTIDTDASDEAICNLTSSVDTSFIELSLTDGRAAAAVALLSVPSARQ